MKAAITTSLLLALGLFCIPMAAGAQIVTSDAPFRTACSGDHKDPYTVSAEVQDGDPSTIRELSHEESAKVLAMAFSEISKQSKDVSHDSSRLCLPIDRRIVAITDRIREDATRFDSSVAKSEMKQLKQLLKQRKTVDGVQREARQAKVAFAKALRGQPLGYATCFQFDEKKVPGKIDFSGADQVHVVCEGTRGDSSNDAEILAIEVSFSPANVATKGFPFDYIGLAYDWQHN